MGSSKGNPRSNDGPLRANSQRFFKYKPNGTRTFTAFCFGLLCQSLEGQDLREIIVKSFEGNSTREGAEPEAPLPKVVLWSYDLATPLNLMIASPNGVLRLPLRVKGELRRGLEFG